LKTYFQKYQYKNTVISDFVGELSQAAFKLGVIKDASEMERWADSWLKTPGCAEI